MSEKYTISPEEWDIIMGKTGKKEASSKAEAPETLKPKKSKKKETRINKKKRIFGLVAAFLAGTIVTALVAMAVTMNAQKSLKSDIEYSNVVVSEEEGALELDDVKNEDAKPVEDKSEDVESAGIDASVSEFVENESGTASSLSTVVSQGVEYRVDVEHDKVYAIVGGEAIEIAVKDDVTTASPVAAEVNSNLEEEKEKDKTTVVAGRSESKSNSTDSAGRNFNKTEDKTETEEKGAN